VIICPFALVSVDSRVGEGTMIYYHSSVDHDAVIGRWCQISAHCDITGAATLGAEVFYGEPRGDSARCASRGPRGGWGGGRSGFRRQTRCDGGRRSGAGARQFIPGPNLLLMEKTLNQGRIYLSTPHMSGEEVELVREAFASNWIAPLGPNVDAFEREFADRVQAGHAVALSSGTAALHLALRWLNLQPNDEVICSTLTFSASVNPVLYERATPVFVDSDERSWNMDPAVLHEAVQDGLRRGRAPKAVVLVHLYGTKRGCGCDSSNLRGPGDSAD